ncbi:MAG: hypothetical protein L6Q92_05765 [Phycisphaerae bacterium]|nr:hypothetical protein [Phycisphaerae bacterium]
MMRSTRGAASGPALLTIHDHDLLAVPSPPAHVDRIIAFFGLAVRPEQRQAAITLIEPQWRKF